MSVTAPAGFAAAGVAAGIKKDGALDVGLIVAGSPVEAAAVFTINQAAAAPVRLSRSHLAASGAVRVIVANSGCANAGTGGQGKAAAQAMAAAAAEAAGCAEEEVLVASTGPIGPQLSIEPVTAAIRSGHEGLSSTPAAGTRAAEAILTTDTVTKEVTVEGPGFTVGGMAKGSGMIRPDMATMLAFLTTDAAADHDSLSVALERAVDETFHALTIDGCGSTNDMVAVLASGESGVVPDPGALESSLIEACIGLSHMMAADAEGARRVVTLDVTGAADDATARAAGRAIADSALVRASFYGGDPNWGRLLGALGASNLPFEPDSFAVAYEGVSVAEAGVAVGHDATSLLELLESGDIQVDVVIGGGPGKARVLTTDLTPAYVAFNGECS